MLQYVTRHMRQEDPILRSVPDDASAWETRDMLVHEPRVQAPQLESYSDLPLFNTKAVVHQTGVPAPTLRAWERRYGILAPRRGDNDYRLYSERDMAIITWLHERITSGLTISQAIALLRSLEPARRRGRRVRVTGSLAHEEPERAAPMAPSLAVSKFSLDDMSLELLNQLVNLDETAASRTIAQAFAVYTVEDICIHLFVSTLTHIGQMWQDGDITSAVEHFATALIRERLECLFRSSPTNEGAPLMLAGCAPGELHELGSLMMALFLRRAGLRVVYLGQSIELDSLINTIKSAKPAGLLLSASLHSQAEALSEVGRRLAALGPCRPTFYFGGQAFNADPDLALRIQGAYLGLDAPEAALEIKRRLTA